MMVYTQKIVRLSDDEMELLRQASDLMERLDAAGVDGAAEAADAIDYVTNNMPYMVEDAKGSSV